MNLKLLGASFCCECKVVKKLLEDNGIDFEFIDLDLKPEYAKEYNVEAMPVVVNLNKQGKEDGRWDPTKGSILAWVKFIQM